MLLTDVEIGSLASRVRRKIEMVKLLEEEDATDTAKIVFNDIKQTFGMIPNLFKAIAAANPGWLETPSPIPFRNCPVTSSHDSA